MGGVGYAGGRDAGAAANVTVRRADPTKAPMARLRGQAR